MAAMTIPIVHIDQDRNERLHPWTESKRQLWMASKTVNVIAAGRWMALREMEIIGLTPAEAADLLKVGYIQPLTPETAIINSSEKAVLAQGRKRR